MRIFSSTSLAPNDHDNGTSEIQVISKGKWISKENRGRIYGMMTASIPLGNVIGSVSSSALIHYGLDSIVFILGVPWYVVFFIPAGLLLICSIFLILFLKSSPEEVGLVEPLSSTSRSEKEFLLQQGYESKPVGFFRAWLLPGVAFYAFSCAFIKIVNYVLFFWLPFYLSSGT
jgi:OPA family glycerol-3-phosphate transporter-like MFS transporter 3